MGDGSDRGRLEADGPDPARSGGRGGSRDLGAGGFPDPARRPPGKMKRGTILVILAVAAFVALLLWTTLSAQKVECEVCVEFGGGRNCATATAADQKEAEQAAQTTAWGALAPGMKASTASGRGGPGARRRSRPRTDFSGIRRGASPRADR